MKAHSIESRDGLLQELAAIDTAGGWETPAGQRLLGYVRTHIVRPQVRAAGLRGPAAEQAEATGWAVAWETLSRPSIHTAGSPWGLLWVAVRKAIAGEQLAAQYQASVRNSWRAERTRVEHQRAGRPPAFPAPLSLSLLLEAMSAVRQIAGSDRAHLLAACSGGILASIVASHLTQTGKIDQLASLTLLVTVLDQTRVGTVGAYVDAQTAATAIAASRRKGYLDGRQLTEVFAWLRPADLIWNYVVSNYLQGKPPPPFDILAWNADSTRMTARLHADCLNMAVNNALMRPGGVTVLGHDVDLRKIEVDTYVVAGVADHLCPWQSCYRSAQFFGGNTRFVLSTSGHIAALVNPPGNPKSSFLAHDQPLDGSMDPQTWHSDAGQEQGSWWRDYTSWLAERSGQPAPAPAALGSSRHRVLEEAPGSYVLDA